METNNEIKLTEEEIKKIKIIKEELENKIVEFGNLKFEKIAIQQEWNKLNEIEKKLELEYEQTQKNQEIFAKQLREKYGEGVINLESGTFTKNNS
jgi:adenylate kinase